MGSAHGADVQDIEGLLSNGAELGEVESEYGERLGLGDEPLQLVALVHHGDTLGEGLGIGGVDHRVSEEEGKVQRQEDDRRREGQK